MRSFPPRHLVGQPEPGAGRSVLLQFLSGQRLALARPADRAPYGSATKAEAGFGGSVYGTSTKIRALAVTPTVGIKVNDWLSFGFGVTLQDFRVDLKSGDPRYCPAIARAPAAVQGQLFAATSPTRLKGDAYGVGYVAA